jgi:hypothetical protein
VWQDGTGDDLRACARRIQAAVRAILAASEGKADDP